MDLKPIKPKSKSQIKIDSKLKAQLKLYAAQLNQPMRYIVEEVLHAYFESIGIEDSTLRWTKTERGTEDAQDD